MSTERSRRISAAIVIRWTPALAARVGRRIEQRLERRRRGRRGAVVALALLSMAGVGFALTRPWTRRAPSAVSAWPSATIFAPPTTPPAEPAPAPLPDEEEAVRTAVPSRVRPARHVSPVTRPAAPEETVAALFAAADAARLEGRPADAVAPLTTILARHSSDPRAVVAAYQLGRILAFDVHDRARAAAAFARAHDLAPNGPLAADAAAHAAELSAASGTTK